jgi:hypothetical protein
VTKREQRLSVAILAFIVLAAFGFFGYQFVLVPLKARDGQIANLQNEIDEKLARVQRIKKRQPDLEKWQKISLPADAVDPAAKAAPAAAKPGAAPEAAHADLARREYEDQLFKMFRASGFEADAITIVPKPPDTKTSPQLGNKKPIYSRLEFTVQLKGDMLSLVEWMEKFYKLRLLHQIRKLSIQRPLEAAAARAGRGGANDLDITMTIEALVLDTAEVRKTLQPEKPVDLPPVLAPSRQYASIAGKNIFYGPPPPVQRDRADMDVTPYVRLDGITASGDGPGWVATLWDMIHNHDYEVSPRSAGGFRVKVSYYINGRKRELRSGKDFLELKGDGSDDDEDGENPNRWQVVRINNRELILRKGVKYYALHIGQALADMKELSKEQLTALGIKAEPAAKATSPKDDLDKD